MEKIETWQETIQRIPSIPVPRVIDSEPLLNGQYLRTSRKMICYPDGITRPWEAVSRPEEVVSVLARTRDNVLILIVEYRPLIAPCWNISLPAWLVDVWYTKEEACRKELTEETWYTGDETYFLIDTPPSPGMSNEVISQYFMPDVVRGIVGKHLEPTETIETLEVPMDELDSLMSVAIRNPRRFIVDAKIDQAVAYAKRKNYF